MEPLISYQHKDWVVCSAFSEKGNIVASFAADLSLYVATPTSVIISFDILPCMIGFLIQYYKFGSGSSMSKWVSCLAFSKSAKFLAGGLEDGTVSVWDIRKTTKYL